MIENRPFVCSFMVKFSLCYFLLVYVIMMVFSKHLADKALWQGGTQLFEQAGQQALLHILVHLLFLVITWWAMQAIKFDSYIKKGKVIQARVLFVLVTIAVASLVSSFFLMYLNYSTQLKYLF